MSEEIAITIGLDKDLFEGIKRFAAETNVSWQSSAAAFLEAGLILAQKGKALEGYDPSRCFKWLIQAESPQG